MPLPGRESKSLPRLRCTFQERQLTFFGADEATSKGIVWEPVDAFLRIFLQKSSEKGSEQHSEVGSGRYEEDKEGRKEPSRRSVGLRHRRLRGFSNCFSNHSGENKGKKREDRELHFHALG